MGDGEVIKVANHFKMIQGELPEIVWMGMNLVMPRRFDKIERIDYKKWFAILKEIGYKGWAVYEMCEVLDGGGSIENLDRTAKIFFEYIEQFK